MAQWDDSENQDPNPGASSSYDPYAQIRAMYQQITGGKYTPTDAELSQFGTNIDANYASKINGQIAQWWQQYQASQPPVTPKGAPDPGKGTGGEGGSGSGGNGGNGGNDPNINTAPLTKPFDEKFVAPAPVNLGGPAGIPYIPPTPTPGAAPGFTPPTYTPPPAFKFNAPTAEEALADPGYKFRLQQGTDRLQNWAAAKGTLNDSSTAKDLEDYGQQAASQEYGNLWDRSWQQQTGEYATNYATQVKDPYSIAFEGAGAAYAPQFASWQATNAANTLGYQTQAAASEHAHDFDYMNAWSQYINKQNEFYSNQDRIWNKQFQLANA